MSKEDKNKEKKRIQLLVTRLLAETNDLKVHVSVPCSNSHVFEHFLGLQVSKSLNLVDNPTFNFRVI